jgi:hypothetical protein
MPLYAVLNVHEMTTTLDLKKEVILTMLNCLEKVEGNFFKVNSMIPASVGVRFHKETMEELALTDNFFKAFLASDPKPYQGV